MLRLLLAMCCLVSTVPSIEAGVVFADREQINLTDAQAAEQAIRWGSTHQPLMGGRPEGLEVPLANNFDITDQGLGWDGDIKSSRDAWLLTNPRSIAQSWRPPRNANLSVVVTPGTERTLMSDGKSYKTSHGSMYVRYSADRKTWSSWQVMTHTAGAETDTFHVRLGVPQAARIEYDRLLNDYQQLDVPWKSDESAAAEWINAEHPEFFDNEIPYIGYVQVLYETQLRGSARLKSLDFKWGWAIGGMHLPPRDKAAYKTERDPWNFSRDE